MRDVTVTFERGVFGGKGQLLPAQLPLDGKIVDKDGDGDGHGTERDARVC